MAIDNKPPADDAGGRWLSIYEVAGRMLARPDTVKAWLRAGLLPAEHRGRLGMRIPERAVNELVARHLRAEGFRSADHSLSSGVSEGVLTATEVPEQAVERQGAGWPFRKDGDDSAAEGQLPPE
jgi:hypothetical protein